jgi:hypothetical protein
VWKGFGGNAFRDGYLEAVNSEGIVTAKKMLRGEIPTRDDVPCASCDLYLDMKAKGTFVTWRDILGYFSIKYTVFNVLSRFVGFRWIPRAYRWMSHARACRRVG